MAGDSKYAEIINDCLIKANGSDKLVGAASATLPDLVNKVETMTAMGTLGDIESVVKGHLETMTTIVKFTNIGKNIGLITEDVDLNIRAAIQVKNPETGKAEIQALEANVRGTVKSFKPGELAKAAKAESEKEIATSYFELIIDGEKIVKVDKLNYIYEVYGKSIVDDIKKAIGW